jgi:hypothetical protein
MLQEKETANISSSKFCEKNAFHLFQVADVTQLNIVVYVKNKQKN